MKNKKRDGLAGIYVLLLILLILIGGLIGFDFLSIEYNTRCGDTPVGECLSATPSSTPDIETSEVARGTFSEKGYSVSLSMTIPLGGGAVVGSFSGDCSGVINGNYDGGENGMIRGDARGSCKTPILLPVPASGTFDGLVDVNGGMVSINGTGSALGFSGSRSLILSF